MLPKVELTPEILAILPFAYAARLSFMLSLQNYSLENHHRIDVLRVHEAIK